LALSIAEKLQQATARDLRVAIIVPTVVLLDQWREEIATRSNLPPEAIGLLGAGSDDNFNPETRILICVLNSAARKLPELVRKAGVGASLLLIVDECHRAGATEMQRVLTTNRAFSLGLSATPEPKSAVGTLNPSINERADTMICAAPCLKSRSDSARTESGNSLCSATTGKPSDRSDENSAITCSMLS